MPPLELGASPARIRSIARSIVTEFRASAAAGRNPAQLQERLITRLPILAAECWPKLRDLVVAGAVRPPIDMWAIVFRDVAYERSSRPLAPFELPPYLEAAWLRLIRQYLPPDLWMDTLELAISRPHVSAWDQAIYAETEPPLDPLDTVGGLLGDHSALTIWRGVYALAGLEGVEAIARWGRRQAPHLPFYRDPEDWPTPPQWLLAGRVPG